MNRARLGALGLAAVLAPALLLATGCSVFSSVKKGVDEAGNAAEVCKASIDLYNTQAAKFHKAIATMSTAQPGDTKAVATYNTTMKTELTTLHEGLAKQIAKAKAANVKKGIAGVDAQVSRLAADPTIITKDQTAGQKLDDAVQAMNKACKVKTPTKNPKE